MLGVCVWGGGGGEWGGENCCVCLCVHVFGFCSDSIFWITQPLVTKLSMMVHHHEASDFKIGLLSSRSRPQWGLIWLKHDYFCFIFWTCLLRKHCCDGKGLDCQWLFIWMLIILWTAQPFETKHGMVMHYVMRHNVMGKDWVAIFVVKVTMRTCVVKIWLSTISSELLILFFSQTYFDGTVLSLCA